MISVDTLTTRAVQALCGYASPAAARVQLRRWGIKPVARDLDGQKLWPADQVERARRRPKTPGARTDFLPTRNDVDPAGTVVRVWSVADATVLSTAVDALVDQYDELLALTPRDQRAALASAIGAAGEHMDSSQPSALVGDALSACWMRLQLNGEVIEAAFPEVWTAVRAAAALLGS